MEVDESGGVKDFAIPCLRVRGGCILIGVEANQDLVACELPLFDLGDKVAD